MSRHLARAARRGSHGLRPEARSHVPWLPRLAAGRCCVPLAAARLFLCPHVAVSQQRSTWHAPRDAAPTACGQRRAARAVAAASRGRPLLRASGRSARAQVNAPCATPGAFSTPGPRHLARAARRGSHGLRPEARSYVPWLPRLAAGRCCVPLAAARLFLCPHVAPNKLNQKLTRRPRLALPLESELMRPS